MKPINPYLPVVPGHACWQLPALTRKQPGCPYWRLRRLRQIHRPEHRYFRRWQLVSYSQSEWRLYEYWRRHYGHAAFRFWRGGFLPTAASPIMRDSPTAPCFTTSTVSIHPAPSAKRVVPELQAGLGGVNMKFYYNQQDCNAFTGCSNSSSYLQSSNHFQLHAGAGVSFFVTPQHLRASAVRPSLGAQLLSIRNQLGAAVRRECRIPLRREASRPARPCRRIRRARQIVE